MPVARRGDAPLGVVYTPPAVARAMVELALAPLTGDPLALRICDPAAGEGVFLDAAVQALVARGADEHLVRERCVFGVDVDARALAVARSVTPNVQVGDALAMTWDQPFDLVIGNPPYIRQEQLGDKARLRDFETYDGVADLYVYFIELAHRILRPGGRWCFITPNKWLTAAYGRGLRGFLAKRGSVEGVIDLVGERVFEEDAYASIVWGTQAGQSTPIQAVRGTLASPRAPHDRARWTAEPWHIDEPDDRALIDELERRCPTFGDLYGTPSRGIVTGANDVFVIDAAVRARLLAAEPSAAPLIRALVRGRDLRPYRAAAERYVLLIDHGTPIDQLPGLVAYLAPFRAALEPKRARGDGPGRKPGRYRWYELQDPVGAHSASTAPRLFFQDIQTAPVCALDERGLVPDTTVWTIPTADRYLLAVLNSPLYGWYARRRFPPALNGAVRPKRAYLRALPIAQPPPALRARIEALVERRLAGDDVDAAIAEAVLDAYDLTANQRAVVARGAGGRDHTAARRSRAR